MAKKIIWTTKARERYKEVIDYLLSEWSEKQVSDFIELVDKKLYLLAHFPRIGIRSHKFPELRSLHLTKHNRLIYEIGKDEIYLLEIHDTRQAQ